MSIKWLFAYLAQMKWAFHEKVDATLWSATSAASRYLTPTNCAGSCVAIAEGLATGQMEPSDSAMHNEIAQRRYLVAANSSNLKAIKRVVLCTVPH